MSPQAKERAGTLSSCFRADSFKEWFQSTVFFRAGSAAELTGSQGHETLDLGLISFILLPTELIPPTTTLESTAH